MRPKSVTHTTSVMVEKTARFHVFEQGGARLVEDGRVDAVLLFERLVAVPVSHPFAHRISAVEELHETHPALDQAAGEQTIAGEAGLEFVAVVDAVEFEGGKAFLLKSPTSAALSCILAASS